MDRMGPLISDLSLSDTRQIPSNLCTYCTYLAGFFKDYMSPWVLSCIHIQRCNQLLIEISSGMPISHNISFAHVDCQQKYNSNYWPTAKNDDELISLIKVMILVHVHIRSMFTSASLVCVHVHAHVCVHHHACVISVSVSISI
jgi:hypothetical protein